MFGYHLGMCDCDAKSDGGAPVQVVAIVVNRISHNAGFFDCLRYGVDGKIPDPAFDPVKVKVAGWGKILVSCQVSTLDQFGGRGSDHHFIKPFPEALAVQSLGCGRDAKHLGIRPRFKNFGIGRAHAVVAFIDH